MNHDPSGLDKWISQLGVTNAPVPRAGVQTALDFFYRHMPELPRRLRLAFLRGMDLSKPVRELTLVSPCTVAAFRKCNEDPFKLFYTKPGTGIDRAGLNPSDRQFIRYRLVRTATVLESRCSPALDIWTDDRHYFQAAGGAIQFIIPESYRYLKIA